MGALQTTTRYDDGRTTGDVELMLGTLDPGVAHWFAVPDTGSAPVQGAEHLARYRRTVAALIEVRWVVDHALVGAGEAVIEWTMFRRPDGAPGRVSTRGAERFVLAADGRIAEIRSSRALHGQPGNARRRGPVAPGGRTDGGGDAMATAHLAVEVSGFGRHPQAWRTAGTPPKALLTAAHHIATAQLAAQAGADLLAIPDSFGPGSGLDAVAIAARVAPVVPGIGLVPTVTTTHTEPFHTSKAIATLDLVSYGRAGWEPAVSRTAEEAGRFGRKPAAPPAELWREAAEAIEVVVRLWDSWEDDAVIRDAATGRYVDRDKLHYVDFTGEFFSVKGPSITPRSPQAHPLVVVREEPDSLAVAARWADVVRIAAPDLAAAHAARGRIRAAVADAGRDPDTVAVLLDVEFLLAADENTARRELADLDGDQGEHPASTLRVVGAPDALVDVIAARAVDGITAVPLALPGGLRMLADAVAPLLLQKGLRTPADPSATLRDRFGLPRPTNHFSGV